ncbi:MAG: prolipoprotein diacylglyceryl transferase [Candidatus Magasanikbacteria bacterium]|nr:prolipoprotein diacylglyceryl transferase [Candidatus Magasanikbacteria bacterium]
MIPYFSLTAINIGPVRLHLWGLMVALAFGAALGVAARRAKRAGLNTAVLLDLAVWIIIAAFLGARLAHVFLYNWSYFSLSPWEIIKIWQGGLSSFGGFIGAAAAAVIYARRNQLNFWHYADAIMYGFPLGLGVGRLGCFITHMHPGRLSNSLLAVAYPGGARLDLGLLESLFGFLLFGVYFFWLRQTPRKIFLPLTMLIYGSVRFMLDFNRATDIIGADARYAGLTPAQYGSLLLVLGSVYLLIAHPWAKASD